MADYAIRPYFRYRYAPMSFKHATTALATALLLSLGIGAAHGVERVVIDQDGSGMVSWAEWRDAVTHVSAKKVFDDVDKDLSGTGERNMACG